MKRPHSIDASVPPSERPGLAIAAELVARGSTWVRGCGDSMAPTICDGDQVLLRPVPFEALRPGDVVAIATQRSAILHRIRRIGTDGLVETAGDAMLTGDGPFPREQVLALAVLAERRSARVTLRSTLEFGIAAYVRGTVLLARLGAARWWRRWRSYRQVGASRL